MKMCWTHCHFLASGCISHFVIVVGAVVALAADIAQHYYYCWHYCYTAIACHCLSLLFLYLLTFSSVGLLTVMYVCISLENVNFMLLFKLNIFPYVCYVPFYCHALSHLSLIETVMFVHITDDEYKWRIGNIYPFRTHSLSRILT